MPDNQIPENQPNTDSQPIQPKPKKTRPKSVNPMKGIVKKAEKLRKMHANSLKNLKKWKPGQSGNEGGLPGYDIAAYVAKRAFEQFREEAIQGLGKQLRHGNAYVFKELADRGFGKLKEKLELSGADEIATQLEAARKRSKK